MIYLLHGNESVDVAIPITRIQKRVLLHPISLERMEYLKKYVFNTEKNIKYT